MTLQSALAHTMTECAHSIRLLQSIYSLESVSSTTTIALYRSHLLQVHMADLKQPGHGSACTAATSGWQG